MRRTPPRSFQADATILIDSREQRPWCFPGYRTEHAKLSAGDYSLAGFTTSISIERKSSADLFGTVGTGRARFERELLRLSYFAYPAIIIESDLRALVAAPPVYSRLHPASVIGSLVAWSIRHGVHVWLASDRRHAAALARKLLEHAWLRAQRGAVDSRPRAEYSPTTPPPPHV